VFVNLRFEFEFINLSLIQVNILIGFLLILISFLVTSGDAKLENLILKESALVSTVDNNY
jgi:hypothetical protein